LLSSSSKMTHFELVWLDSSSTSLVWVHVDSFSAGHPHSYSSWVLSHSMLGDLASAEAVAQQAWTPSDRLLQNLQQEFIYHPGW